jgi:multidrug efflux pump
MAARQQALAAVILKDPAVESLSSFIGVDGTNVTVNSGRILINLKPLARRGVSASDVIRRVQPALAGVDGIQLFMQPVQDLTVEDRVSRTQYQYSLEDPNGSELNLWAPRLVDALRTRRELPDVSSDQQDQGLGTALVVDRSTASRLGVTPQAIDNTLYDAFGQRQVSTMFTQLNQYRVVLEVKPEFRQSAAALGKIYVTGTSGGQPVAVPLGHHGPGVSHDGPDRDRAPGTVPGGDTVVQSGPGNGPRHGGRGGRGDQPPARAAREHPGQLPGDGPGVPGRAGQ